MWQEALLFFGASSPLLQYQLASAQQRPLHIDRIRPKSWSSLHTGDLRG